MAKVGETMTRDFVSVLPSAPIVEVAQKMRDSATGVIAVCENGKFRGIVTERGIISHTVATAHNSKRECARALMKSDQPIVSPGEEITQAAKVMVNRGVRVLPVAQNRKLLGLFTLDDLARESLALAAIVLVKTAGERPREAIA